MPTVKINSVYKNGKIIDVARLNNWEKPKVEEGIENAVKRRYVIPQKVTKDISLFDRFSKYSDLYITEVNNCARSESMKELMARIKAKAEREDINTNIINRSFLYNALFEIGCSDEVYKEIKAIIDLCYNEQVAASISDNESDIMVNNNNLLFTEIYSEHIDQDDNLDKVNQKLGLVRNSRNYSKQVFTWELLNQIIESVKYHITNPNEWYDCVQKYCGELSGQELKIQRRKHIIGAIEFAVTSIAVGGASILIKKLIQESNLQDAVIATSTTLAPSLIAFLASKIKEKNLPDPNLKDQQKIINELLTQTSLLKKDYNDR